MEIFRDSVNICYTQIVKLLNSQNGQKNCPFHEMNRPLTNFAEYAILLPITRNEQVKWYFFEFSQIISTHYVK